MRNAAASSWLDIGIVLTLPALMLYLGFNAGGYFADTTGWAAAAMALLLALRLALGGGFDGGPSRLFLLAAAALTLFGLWTVLSGSWSQNDGRALLEFDRTLLYLLVLLVFGSIGRPREMLRFLPLGFAFAAVVLCAAGFVTETLPDAWPFALPTVSNRLAYPVTYSNGLGILAALGFVMCLHIASWERERAIVRVAGAAALPLLAATLVLTFSRGAILAGALGVIIYVAFGRPRGSITALVASVPPVAVAAWAAYDAELLATRDPSTAASIAQGQGLARTVGLAMLGAGLGFGLIQTLERRWADIRLPKPARPLRIGVGVALLVAIGIAIAVLGARAVDSFDRGAAELGAPEREGSTLTRERLADVGGQTRVEYWTVSLDAFADEPLRGTGVGTFARHWDRDRPFAENVTEGHSVYLETLGELGIVGVLLIVVVLALLVAPFLIRRRDQRPLQAVGLAAAGAWLVHAGIDWDWELPVVTVWLFAFGGCALAGLPDPVGEPWRARLPVRIVLVAACLLATITPVTIAISQTELNESVAALRRGDCTEAARLARASSSALSSRYEPYEILAYCASRSGDEQGAVALMNSAIDRDPDNWRLYYGLAVVRGAAGEDPRAAAATAVRLNPLEEMARSVVRRFDDDDPEVWRRRALAAPLPL